MDSAKAAARLYSRMSEGWDLSHAPESLLQSQIAIAIFKKRKHNVYSDASVKKLLADWDDAPPVPKKLFSLRPDIAVWDRKESRLISVIEVKARRIGAGIRKDVARVERFVDMVPIGYLLVATSIDKRSGGKKETMDEMQAILDRLKPDDWTIAGDRLGWVPAKEDEKGWAWGCILLRYRKA